MLRRLIVTSAVVLSFAAPAYSQALNGDVLVGRINQSLRAQGKTEVEVRNERNEAAGTATTAADTAASTAVATASAPNEAQDDVDRALDVIDGAGERIASKFCRASGRPATVMMSLAASFTLIFGGETGTEVTWDIDKLCERLGLAG